MAAIGDIHVSRHSQGAFRALFTQITNNEDVLLVCGDFTAYGLPEEAQILAHVAAGIEGGGIVVEFGESAQSRCREQRLVKQPAAADRQRSLIHCFHPRTRHEAPSTSRAAPGLLTRYRMFARATSTVAVLACVARKP